MTVPMPGVQCPVCRKFVIPVDGLLPEHLRYAGIASGDDDATVRCEGSGTPADPGSDTDDVAQDPG